jgi:DNA-damage-inducible protein D
MEQNNKIILFQEKQIRRDWHNNEWYFSIIDVIEVLSESQNPRRYWSDLKRKLTKEGYNELYEKIVQLKMIAPDGKMRDTDTANNETLFRIIMSIPSPKAEPFRLWLAQVGKEHIAEIENPELAADRARDLYKAKGYSDEWINYRLKSIGIRQELTDEWKERGVKEGQEYAILTAEISKATFGLTPSEYKDVKNLERQNLRDHMTNLELIFTMLGEESTRRYAVKNDAQGFEENREAAIEGGEAAGASRESFEKRTGEKVVVPDNFLNQINPSESED